MRQRISKPSVVLLFLLLALCSIAPAQQSQDKSGHSNWTWSNSDGGHKIEVRIEDKVQFNDDYSDVAAIPAGGALRIADSRGPHSFRLVITRDASGNLRRDYSIDGQSRS